MLDHRSIKFLNFWNETVETLLRDFRGSSLTRTFTEEKTRSHPEMVGDMSCVTLNFDLSKILCASLARVKTYTHTKNLTCTFTGSHLRAVTDADDNAPDNTVQPLGRHIAN